MKKSRKNKMISGKKRMSYYYWILIALVVIVVLLFAFNQFKIAKVLAPITGHDTDPLADSISVSRTIELLNKEMGSEKNRYKVNLEINAPAGRIVVIKEENFPYEEDMQDESFLEDYDYADFSKEQKALVYGDASEPIITDFSYIVSAYDGDVVEGNVYFIGNGVRQSESIVGDTAFRGNSVRRLCYGDANGDGAVDLQDFGALKDNFGVYGGATWAMGDFVSDGNVDLQDFGKLKDNFGKTPESGCEMTTVG